MKPQSVTPRDAQGLDRVWSRERERVGTPGPVLSPVTIRRIKALGLLSGWRCAEIGDATGSTALWLAQRVGRLGRVVAVDADTSGLERLPQDCLQVRRHDIAASPLEEKTYDFVHARLALLRLPRRTEALRNMVASLRPGGWLLAEEDDPGADPESRDELVLMEALHGAGLHEVRCERQLEKPVVSAWGQKPAAPFYTRGSRE